MTTHRRNAGTVAWMLVAVVLVYGAIAAGGWYVDRRAAERSSNRQSERVQADTASCRRGQQVRGALMVAAELTDDKVRRRLYQRTFQLVDCLRSSTLRRSVPLTRAQSDRYLAQIRRFQKPLTYNP